MELQLSKRQIRTLAGLGSEVDVQRMQAVFLDVGCGKQLDEVTCPTCQEVFVKRQADPGACCCTECQQTHTYTLAKEKAAIENVELRAKRLARHGRVF